MIVTTMQFSQSLSHRLSHCSQDNVPAGIMETSQMSQHSSAQSASIRYSLPLQGLRHRSDAYRSATVTQPVQRSVIPHRDRQAARLRVTEYDKTHRLHIQQRLQHRIAAAMAKGDQQLVNLLQQEMRQAS